ncbi:MAG: IS200/IS605 family transposase, partial [Holdemanella porci]|uniref:IS200/IS605 family transposase n=1 Tax=Holdemanella porci TaxID=2652276 RepID=UPI002431C091
MEVVKGRGYVYSIQYHIVWCVKYRRNILNGQVATILKELLTQISKDNGFQILEMNIEEDYIRMLINCTPQHYIPNIIKAMKGV